MKAPFGTATRADQWLVIVLSAAVIVGTLIGAVRRVVEIIPNQDVPVEIPFDSQRQAIVIEGVGEVSAELDRAVVIVPELPLASWMAALVGVIVPALAVVAVMVCVAWLCRNLAAGAFFSPTNTRLLTTASLCIAGGWLVSVITTTLTGNGALARIGPEDGGTTVSMTVSFEYLFAAIVVGCLAAAFYAGERLQRDAEGLV